MLDQPLSGIKVLDLGHYIAGPFCAKLLADYGAEVIKVERPDGGDPARRMGPFLGDVPHPEKSGLFLHLNTNKQGITLNLKTETGQRIVKELVREADILVESFRPGVMASLGLSYEELSQINPNLIMTSISNFGQNGPYRDLLMSELTLFAMGGKMASHGIIGRDPLRLPGVQSQCQGGNVAAMATMFAFYACRHGEGGGQQVDVALYETQMASFNSRMNYLTSYVYTSERFNSRPAAGIGGYPDGVYPCKDGFIMISGGTQAWWANSVALLGMPELLDHPRFSGLGQYDQQAKEEFETTIWLPWLMERTKKEFVELAQAQGIPSIAVTTIDEVVESPQFQARGYFVDVEHPVAGRLKYPGAPFGPFQAAGEWWQVRRPAPTLGQHNEEIYCGQLGYTREDLTRLRERGVT